MTPDKVYDRGEGRAWPAASFQVAMPQGPVKRDGYAWRGLGLFLAVAGSPKGRRKPKWSLTHLGSGHAIAFIDGDVREVFPVATEIALAGDWTFDGLEGWRNQFPDAPAKMAEIAARHKHLTKSSGAHRNEDVARAVAASREAA